MMFVLALSYSALSACDINLNVVGDKKAKYAVGDELVVKVEVVLTHRNCHVDIDETKFKTTGFKVVGQTKWTEKSSGVWERKLKVQVTAPVNGKSTINVERTCNKEGGYGSLSVSAG